MVRPVHQLIAPEMLNIVQVTLLQQQPAHLHPPRVCVNPQHSTMQHNKTQRCMEVLQHNKTQHCMAALVPYKTQHHTRCVMIGTTNGLYNSTVVQYSNTHIHTQ
jgi:hypothetical protein